MVCLTAIKFMFMTIHTTREEVLQSIKTTKNLGLVPTMGALHEGHLSLVSRALKENETVWVTIFVNPTQFNDPSDFEKYPKTLESDLKLLEGMNKNIQVFAPLAQELYPDGLHIESFDLKSLDTVMEGTFRPGHFDGVGTVVLKLFELFKPEKAYFGEKDYQQLQIIKQLTEQRGLHINIIGCPILREDNGLAMSSRNTRLTNFGRNQAGDLHKTLMWVKQHFGLHPTNTLKEKACEMLQKNSAIELEYFEISDAKSLQPTEETASNTTVRAFVAARVEGVRLIDNIALN